MLVPERLTVTYLIFSVYDDFHQLPDTVHLHWFDDIFRRLSVLLLILKLSLLVKL